MDDMTLAGAVLLALIALATWAFLMWLILAPLGIAEAPENGCAIARITPDECWHLMEDR